MYQTTVNIKDVSLLGIKEIPLNISVFWSKIHQYSTWRVEQAHIVEELCSVIIVQIFHRFALNDDVALADKVNAVVCGHWFAVIGGVEGQFFLKLDILFLKLNL